MINRLYKTIVITIVSFFCINDAYTQTWLPVGSGMNGGYIYTLCHYDSVLYAGGTFIEPGNHIAQWNGGYWQGLGSGTNGYVDALGIYKQRLFVGGFFSSAGGISATDLVEWNGANWFEGVLAVPSYVVTAFDTINKDLLVGNSGGFTFTYVDSAWGNYVNGINQVNAMCMFKDSLYEVGYKIVYPFYAYLGESFIGYFGVMRKAGSNYSWAKKAKFTSVSATADLNCMAEYNGYLFIGGIFDSINGSPMSNIVCWNGNTFLPVESINGQVYALQVFDGKLYAGGLFDSAGGKPANNIACWNGSSWSALGQGVNNVVFALDTFQGNLYVGGGFTNPYNYIAKFDTASDNTVRIFQSVSIFPNPTSGILYIGIPSGAINSELEIYDMLGQKMYSNILNTTYSQLNLPGFASGIYFYLITSSSGNKVASGKFIRL
jgi:hypothetical protein